MWRAVNHTDAGAVRTALGTVGIDGLLVWRELASPESQIWAYHSHMDGSLEAVLVRKAHRWLVWYRGTPDWEAATRQLCMEEAGFCIEGPSGPVGTLQRALSGRWQRYDEEAAILALRDSRRLAPLRTSVRRCQDSDCRALGSYFGSEGATWRDENEIRSILAERRIFAVWVDGEAVSAALTLAEAPGSSLIGGVFTRPAHRTQGLASQCVSALAMDLLGEGRTVWLICNNPGAESMYRALGFVEEGCWIRSYYSAQ